MVINLSSDKTLALLRRKLYAYDLLLTVYSKDVIEVVVSAWNTALSLHRLKKNIAEAKLLILGKKIQASASSEHHRISYSSVVLVLTLLYAPNV